MTVTDALVLECDERSPRVSDVHPHDQLVRRVRCERGSVEVELLVQPRFDYGLTRPHVRVRDAATATVVGGADGLVLGSGIELEQRGWAACGGTARLSRGDEHLVVLTYRAPYGRHRTPPEESRPARGEILRRLEATIGSWRDWAGKCDYTGAYREKVVRSELTLKGLTDARTGAITAAATTSLPMTPVARGSGTTGTRGSATRPGT